MAKLGRVELQQANAGCEDALRNALLNSIGPRHPVAR
jgi:hypothetical protein